MAELLKAFRDIDLNDVTETPIKIDYVYLERLLRLDRDRVWALMLRARELGLLSRLTIDYDYLRWLQLSADKGCLVVMTCVEEGDLRRSSSERTGAYCDAIDAIRNAIVADRQKLRQVVIVPNGHLAPRAGDGLPWQEVLQVLDALPPALKARGYEVSLNSYGYTKLLHLAIHAHKLGYVLRVV